MEDNNQAQTTPFLKRIANIEQAIKDLQRQINVIKKVLTR